MHRFFAQFFAEECAQKTTDYGGGEHIVQGRKVKLSVAWRHRCGAHVHKLGQQNDEERTAHRFFDVKAKKDGQDSNVNCAAAYADIGRRGAEEKTGDDKCKFSLNGSFLKSAMKEGEKQKQQAENNLDHIGGDVAKELL